jgi:hypothetical protein
MTDKPDLPALHHYAADILGQPLATYITEKRNEPDIKWSWRAISRRLARDTGDRIRLTPDHLAAWYPDDTKADTP